MLVDWRREDSGYAAATLVAGAVVAFFVAGNFGLVPSPLAPAAPVRRPPVRVAALSSTPGATRSTPRSTLVPVASTGPPTSTSPASVDRQPPSVAFTTADGETITGVTEGATVQGTASDSGSGVRAVDVTFEPSTGGASEVSAELECTDVSHRSCSWSARVPGAAGNYTVRAKATDRDGNASTAGPIGISVVNPGGPIQDLTDDRLVGTVVGVVVGLL
jgi:hypothetical protein